MKIYTKTGDRGETSLFGGKRVLKCHDLVDAYGSLDELNSWVGMLRSLITEYSIQKNNRDISIILEAIQNDLFVIGSTLAGWKGDMTDIEKRVPIFEKAIDEMDAKLPELRNFILPGGTQAAAYAHLARAVCRRVERQIVALFNLPAYNRQLPSAQQSLIFTYLNRLSDLLFVLARYINNEAGHTECVWHTRSKLKK